MSAVCEVYGPYHTFDVPTDNYGRRCACGTTQVYRPPTGKAVEFSDVLVDVEDLRVLLAVYRESDVNRDCDQGLIERLEVLLFD